MAVGADVAVAFAASLVPIPHHASVRTVAIIPGLRTMTLAAQRQRVLVGDRLAVSCAQGVVVVGIMTAQATQLTVGVDQSRMKFAWPRHLPGLVVGWAGGVASRTTHAYLIAAIINFVGQHVGLRGFGSLHR